MTVSLDAALSTFEVDNAPVVPRLSALLDRICASKTLHALFLNTLSMMEHIGSRKIMATQARAEVDQPTLKHLAEESRHAFFLKRHAETAAGRPMSYAREDVLAAPAARMYFQRLELAMRTAFAQPSVAVYLYMSMIVEFRAIWGYAIYQRSLTRHGHRLPLKGLLAEERSHLTDMAARLDTLGDFSAERIKAFAAVETRLFARFVDALEREPRVVSATSQTGFSPAA